MKLLTCLAVVLALTFAVSGEQQRILRRVIKSTPTATTLTRVRAVTVRSAQPEAGAVTEISGKEAANFDQRGTNATVVAPAPVSPATKTKASSSTTTTTTTTTNSPTTTSTTTAAPTTSAPAAPTTVAAPAEATKRRASERQQTQPAGPEVELLSSAPSSWQTMTAVEAPAAMLIATGTRPAVVQSDLSASGSNLHSSEESAVSTGDFLRSSASKTSSSYSQSAGETFSRVRQQSKQNQQQSFFHPQPAPQRAASKTSNYKQATKTHWYQPPTTTSRPAPIIQQEQQYEQQNEQYVEQQQQQQVEYGAAPLGQAEPFAFDFKTEDNSGNGQYRKEESDKNGVVRGSYGYTDANGIYRHVDYVADQNGFRANIKSNEPGLIGETQPASIQLAGGPSAQPSSRLQAAPVDNGEWNGNLGENQGPSGSESALAPPDFESSHKSDRIRVPRHYRN